MLVIGDRESENGEVNVRTRSGKAVNMGLDAFCDAITAEVQERASVAGIGE